MYGGKNSSLRISKIPDKSNSIGRENAYEVEGYSIIITIKIAHTKNNFI